MTMHQPRRVFTDTPYRLTLLSKVLDQFSQRRLSTAGLHPASRCLEVGAGTGSIAVWLAEQVGPVGQVVATDLNIDHIPNHPNLTPVVHNIATDTLEDAGGFDLIHARLVISQQPNRWAVVDKLAQALVPGGALVVEEFVTDQVRYVMQPDDDPEPDRLFNEYHDALVALLDASGKDTEWDMALAMTRAGLHNLNFELWTRSWTGGSAGTDLYDDTADQLRDRLVQHGMKPADVEAFRQCLTRDDLNVYMHWLQSAIGYKPW